METLATWLCLVTAQILITTKGLTSQNAQEIPMGADIQLKPNRQTTWYLRKTGHPDTLVDMSNRTWVDKYGNLQIESATYADSGTYIVKWYDRINDKFYDPDIVASLNVNGAAKWEARRKLFKEGDNIVLECPIASSKDEDVKWQREDELVKIRSENTAGKVLTVLDARDGDAGRYICTVGTLGTHFDVIVGDEHQIPKEPTTDGCTQMTTLAIVLLVAVIVLVITNTFVWWKWKCLKKLHCRGSKEVGEKKDDPEDKVFEDRRGQSESDGSNQPLSGGNEGRGSGDIQMHEIVPCPDCVTLRSQLSTESQNLQTERCNTMEIQQKHLQTCQQYEENLNGLREDNAKIWKKLEEERIKYFILSEQLETIKLITRAPDDERVREYDLNDNGQKVLQPMGAASPYHEKQAYRPVAQKEMSVHGRTTAFPPMTGLMTHTTAGKVLPPGGANNYVDSDLESTIGMLPESQDHSGRPMITPQNSESSSSDLVSVSRSQSMRSRANSRTRPSDTPGSREHAGSRSPHPKHKTGEEDQTDGKPSLFAQESVELVDADNVETDELINLH